MGTLFCSIIINIFYSYSELIHQDKVSQDIYSIYSRMNNKCNLLLRSSPITDKQYHMTSFSWMVCCMVCNAHSVADPPRRFYQTYRSLRSSDVVRFPITRLTRYHAVLNHYILQGKFCFWSFCLKMKVNVYKTRKSIFVHAKIYLNS